MTRPALLLHTTGMTLKSLPAWVPYAAPFVLFLLLTSVEAALPKGVYPLAYTVKIALVTLLLIALRKSFPEARPGGGGWAIATALGVVLCLMWVWVTPHTPPLPAFLGGGKRIGFNPMTAFATSAGMIGFLAVRFFGLVVVVPIMEELFYRSFLLRFATDMDDFERVPLGAFSAIALLVNVALFALSHPEWLAAAIFALAMCLLVRYTKNLFACILCHATTNLLLGIFVLHTGQWQYW